MNERVLVFSLCNACFFAGHDMLPRNACLKTLRCPVCKGTSSDAHVVDAPLEFQGPRLQKRTTFADGRGTAVVEVPVGYEHHLTPAEREFVRALARKALGRDLR